jgi:U3 small nucleolar RNA-associated protein 10
MVVKKVVDVATTLSRIAGENDDVTLQRALENALKSVVPVWLSSGKADVKEVIWTIVEASTRAPERRRAPLCAALIRACPEGSKGLSELILQVLENRNSLEKSAEAHKKKMYAMLYQNDAKKKTGGNLDLMDLDDNNADVDDDVDDEDDELEDEENNNKTKSNTWVKSLVMTLLGHEKPVNAVVTLVDAMKVRLFSPSFSFFARDFLNSFVRCVCFGEEFVYVSGF